ncbi:hypothetical protein GQR60_14560 [Labilibaculum sp. A4]|uniref:Lipocalin-like domain-containing protein n=1 Tax=Labilibaculum euxinus TaxID=2686357 RepID=A0A425Y8T0_9BACT|nr:MULTISPECIES: hypothetical protein [Labilibaculum]MDQ1770226.1 hypothetical protein [Labilibaculum euxinus]MUP37579.1 hypothetical protein [Labilibaculum euxinus]MVB06784.1 hypothetical protein [Labilibaculum euxinus]MWN77559.1 hypothetical protein [Labilibaculum euxinus]
MKNITGRWTFNEDFGFGKDEGFAEFTQEGDSITGVVVYTERIDDETPFRVQQEVEGNFDGVNFKVTGTKVELLDVENQFEYHLDTWEGILNANNQIVGHSYDDHDCFGVFVMEFIELQ